MKPQPSKPKPQAQPKPHILYIHTTETLVTALRDVARAEGRNMSKQAERMLADSLGIQK